MKKSISSDRRIELSDVKMMSVGHTYVSPYEAAADVANLIKDKIDVPEDRFTLIHRTPTNDDTGGRYVHSMIYPDLRFIDKSAGRKFWVEVKYRSHAEPDGSIVWCADNQLTNYKRRMYESRCKVFIIMGVGGTVQRPDKVYCLDLENINFTKLFYGTYKNHRIMFGTVESLRQLEYIANLDHS